MQIQRTSEIKLLKSRLRNNPVVAILGPRQCGKTTLARQFSDQWPGQVSFFDLENPVDLRRLEEPLLSLENLSGLIVLDEIQQFIGELKQQGIGVLITDHNVRETLGTCDYGYLMKEGQVFFHGSPEEIIQNEQAKRFYLGESFTLS